MGDTGQFTVQRPFQLDDLDHAGTYVVDDRGRIVEVNPQAERLLRRKAGELVGRDAHDLLHRGERGEPLPRSRCVMREPLLTNDSAHGCGVWLERGDGSLVQISWMVTPCRVGEAGSGALVLFHETGSAGLGERQRARPAPTMSELDRLALLAETTSTLTASLDVDETLRQLVRLVVPLLGDWAVVDLLTEEGEVTRAAVVHHENGVLAHRADLERPMPPLPLESTMPLARALRGVTAALVGPEDYEGRLESRLAAVQRDLFEATGIWSACTAPIRGVREVVGAMTLGRAEQPQPYTTDDMLLIEDIARRAGLALDNARLYERQRRVAETMQRHLLPRLPSMPGLEMGACYVPAPRASQVGGDWYDAFVLSDGAAGVVIGDVVGHDLDAASGMAQVCNMLRAYAGELEEPPSVIVDRLDQAVARMAETTMATVVFGRVEREDGGWRLRWTNAGHPPPLLVEGDGRTRYLDEASGLLLGTGFAPAREDAAVELPPRSTVLFYTDGLIESPSHSLDEGLDRLRRQAAALTRHPLSAYCDRLLTRVRPADNDDDVALLTLRIPG
ncbi:SpoIIE family protein phosphatase [Nonomuraea sp. PA05]|uniref:SpoIIE family protein phosphatase n=1 Tax=Nonomuraea sp. PA05 TaxID=2604466 RepID=UPI0011D556A7|nr:SpoIIE family protein phosphatase [Nonomuraea sp. PA05]TYB61491.1 SpoIIE family protein phosphatase [Nonomuraea sp. PA05]